MLGREREGADTAFDGNWWDVRRLNCHAIEKVVRVDGRQRRLRRLCLGKKPKN
jgi:hypothetical protein